MHSFIGPIPGGSYLHEALRISTNMLARDLPLWPTHPVWQEVTLAHIALSKETQLDVSGKLTWTKPVRSLAFCNWIVVMA